MQKKKIPIHTSMSFISDAEESTQILEYLYSMSSATFCVFTSDLFWNNVDVNQEYFKNVAVDI